MDPPRRRFVHTAFVTTTIAIGGTSDTLADVAAYYYKTDLRTTGLTAIRTKSLRYVRPELNNVLPSLEDDATYQHMTTYTLGLGAPGRMIYSSTYKTDTTGHYPAAIEGGSTATGSGGPCSVAVQRHPYLADAGQWRQRPGNHRRSVARRRRQRPRAPTSLLPTRPRLVGRPELGAAKHRRDDQRRRGRQHQQPQYHLGRQLPVQLDLPDGRVDRGIRTAPGRPGYWRAGPRKPGLDSVGATRRQGQPHDLHLLPRTSHRRRN